MIIGNDSPLRRLPDGLDWRQATYLDGIRYSVEMADLAYDRLCSVLWTLSTESKEDRCQRAKSLVAESFLNAWSIVDSVHRLRQLLDQTPRLRKAKSTTYQLFVRKTSPVEEFRNTIQHLRNELDQMSQKSWPVWGVLDWVAVADARKGLLRCCVMTSGKTIDGKYPICNPAGKNFEGQIDHICLQSKENRLPLSDTMRSVRSLIEPFERSLAKEFRGMPTPGSELLVTLDIQVELYQAEHNA